MSSSSDKFTNECQIRMKWRLKEKFLKEKLKDLGNRFIDSDVFNASNIPGVQYCLRLGLDKNDKNENKFEETFVGPTGYGDALCTLVELFNPEENYFVDGIMEIKLEATLKSLGIKRKATESLSLANALWENDDKDLTIAVKERKLMVHKLVLCAQSPVFKAELNSGMKEAIENTINITDFSFECVKIAMEFCYEQNIDEQVTEENASELLHFADKYDIKYMHSTVQTLLIDKLEQSNVSRFANMSVTSNARKLREYCICFLLNASKKQTIVKGANELNAEILQEIGRRSLFSTSE